MNITQNVVSLHTNNKAVRYYMKKKFNISGMTCAACVAHVQKAVESLEGTSNVSVNLITNTMTLDMNTDILDKTRIIKAVEKAGYHASDTSETQSSKKKNTINKNLEKEVKSLHRRLIISVVFIIPLMYISMGSMWGLPLVDLISHHINPIGFAMTQFLLTLPIVYINRLYYIKGYKSLFNGASNMDTLIAIGSSAALVYGIFAIYMIGYGLAIGNAELVKQYCMNIYFESAAMILTLITVGKYLEAKSKGKTGEALERLMSLSPSTALIERQGIQTEVPIEEVVAGDIVIIKPGGTIPIDGVIIEGVTSIDESAITGESIPVEKGKGSKVIQATINKTGFLKVKATKVGDDTLFAEILRLVEDAATTKAPIAKLADSVSGVFVPIVIIIALLTAIIWLIIGQSFEFALSFAIAVLVISCPCALGLATPVAIMVGTGKGAENGILIKSGEALEMAHKLETVVFDKTGTITEGKPQVTDIISYGINEKELLTIAYSLEIKSEHPLAEAIIQYAKQTDTEYKTVDNFHTIVGKGLVGEIDGIKYSAGNQRLMKDNGIVVDEYCSKEMNRLNSEGKTVLIFARNNLIIGVIGVADIIKPTSKQAIDLLKKMNIETVMLTGDNQAAAQGIANHIKIDKVIAEVLPQDKERVISSIMDNGRKTAMVGDGINDSPALVKANVGIAIGDGTDIAIESADIVLMKNDLLGVPSAIKLSKAVIKNIKQNLFWAFFYNILGIPLAAGLLYPVFGLRLTPVFGAAAMSLSSIFVVTNALRLRKFKPYNQLNQPKESIIMKKIFVIEGMMCQNCVNHVQRALNNLGIVATIDLESKTATITNSTVNDDTIIKAITDAGYEVKEVLS